MTASVARGGLRHPFWYVFVPVFLLTTLLSACWALATPVFASPDENAHAMKAVAQWRGQLLPHARSDSRFPVYDLPDGYRYSPGEVCFAFRPEQPADCGVAVGDPGGTPFFVEWVGSYDPVYYWAVGWPSRILDGSHGIYAMRLMSAVIVGLLMAGAATAALAGRRSRWMPIAVLFAAGPMEAFLGGSINPQAVEFAGGVLLTAALLRLIENHHDPASTGLGRITLWILTVAGAAALALPRATGPLWVVVIVALVFTAAGWRRAGLLFRRAGSYPWIAAIAVIGAASAAWTLVTGTLGGQAQAADAPLVGGSPLHGAWAMLRGTPFFLQSAAGVFGWQDTILPTSAYGLYFGVVLLVLVLSVVAAVRRDRVAVVIGLAAALLVPVVVQTLSVSRTGIIWQGRYGLFLYLAVIVIAAWALSRAPRADFLSLPVTAVAAILLTVYGIIAFAVVLKRYVVGAHGTVTRMLTSPDWQPPLGWPALVVAAVVVLSILGLWTVLAARAAARRESIASEADATA